jgi:hypothetical protein
VRITKITSRKRNCSAHRHHLRDQKTELTGCVLHSPYALRQWESRIQLEKSLNLSANQEQPL